LTTDRVLNRVGAAVGNAFIYCPAFALIGERLAGKILGYVTETVRAALPALGILDNTTNVEAGVKA
jgi:hypothetical protein